jgi:hypothetical protein
VRLDYRFADRDGSANVVWSIDRDTNPYNGNDVRVRARDELLADPEPHRRVGRRREFGRRDRDLLPVRRCY